MWWIYGILDLDSPLVDNARAWAEEGGGSLRQLSAWLLAQPGNFARYRGFSLKQPALKKNLDPRPAQQLFERHLRGEDHSDQSFLWVVLTKRCREGALA